MEPHNIPPKKPVPMYLIAIVVTLVVIVSILGIKLYQVNDDLSKSQEEGLFLQEQKIHLENELNTIIVTYDSLKTENDTINQQLAAQQEYIRGLMKQQASNVYKIRRYQEELETLRKVMRSYIVQIDSLNTRNRELTEENQQVKTQLTKVESDYKKLHTEKEELSTTVAQAKRLSAKNILAEGIKSRQGREGKPNIRADKIDKVRVCFTVRENQVADPGVKLIYLRISSPNDVILSSADAGMFEYEGELIPFSAKRELEYDNADIDMCIYWDMNEELTSGTYYVTLYCEGFEIGSTTFNLK